MNLKSHVKHICPVARSRALDNSIRKFVQNPQFILRGHVGEGMTVLDLGCGPGFFSVEMAKMVGPKGKVIAADVQKEMLDKLKEKLKYLESVNKRIKLHKTSKDKIGLKNKVDFVLAFYVLHEVENKQKILNEIKSLMKKNSRFLLVEPLFHVSKNAFEETVGEALSLGFKEIKRPRGVISRAVLLGV